MAKQPKNPSSPGSPPGGSTFGGGPAGPGGAGGGPPPGPEWWQRFSAAVSKASEEARKKVDELQKAVKKLWEEISEKLTKAYKGLGEQSTKTTKGIEEVGEAGVKTTAKMRQMGFVAEAVGVAVGTLLLGAVQKTAKFLSSVFAPNVEAVTGGLAKSDEAARRLTVTQQRLAIAIEQGQQRALKPFREGLESVLQKLLDLNGGWVRATAETGQYISIVLEVIAALAKLAAQVLLVGGALGLLVKIFPALGAVMAGGIAGMGKMAVEAGLLTKAWGAMQIALQGVMVALRFISVPVAIIAGLAAITVAVLRWRGGTEEATGSLKEQLEEMKKGSTALRRLAEEYESVIDKMTLARDTARAQVQIDQALAAGQADVAAAIRRTLAEREREIRFKEELRSLTEQLIEKEGLLPEKARETAEAMLRQKQVAEAAAEVMRLQAEHTRSRLEALRLAEEIERRTFERRETRIEREEGRPAAERQRELQRELELARARGASARDILAIQKEMVAEAMKEREAGLERLEREKELVDNVLKRQREEFARLRDIEQEATNTAAGRTAILDQIVGLEKEKEATLKRIEGINERIYTFERAGDLQEREAEQQRLRTIDARLEKLNAARDAQREVKGLTEDESRAYRALGAELADNLEKRQQILAAQKELREDAALLHQLEVRRAGIMREEVELRRQLKDAEEDVQRASGRFDPERAFGRARREFVMSGMGTGGEEEIRRAREALADMRRFAEETSDERLQRRAAELGRLFARRQVTTNAAERQGVEGQIAELKAQLDQAKNPLGEILQGSIKIGDRMIGWNKTVREYIDLLKEARTEYEHLGRTVEAAPGEVAIRRRGGDVDASTGGTTVLPGIRLTPGGVHTNL